MPSSHHDRKYVLTCQTRRACRPTELGKRLLYCARPHLANLVESAAIVEGTLREMKESLPERARLTIGQKIVRCDYNSILIQSGLTLSNPILYSEGASLIYGGIEIYL